jgi:hypothetical protein
MKRNTKGFLGIAALCLVTVFALFAATGCSNKMAEADELYDQKDYAGALALYQELDESQQEEVADKMSECRFWMYIDWLVGQGSEGYKYMSDSSTYLTEMTMVKGSSDGSITLDYSNSTVSDGDSSMYTFTVDIKHGETTATIAGTYQALTTAGSGGTATEEANGTFDISTLKSGDKVSTTLTKDVMRAGILTSSLGVNMLDYNSKFLTFMMDGLQETLEQSGTGCTLADIGFTSY